MPGSEPIAVLEIGGTHVTSALVATADWSVGPRHRVPLDAQSGADVLLRTVLATAALVRAPSGTRWSVALPGPFDYLTGIGRYRDVGKFDRLAGVDVGAALRAGIEPTPTAVTFVNDASAFALGEWLIGAAVGTSTSVAITLGTGVGSAFVRDGKVVEDGPEVPPEGEVHRLHIAGTPLEDVVSRHAIRAAYAASEGLNPAGLRDRPDVAEIAARARGGEPAARAVLTTAFTALGAALGPWVMRFEAEVVVVGGAIAGSWDLISGPLAAGLATGSAGAVPVRPTRVAELSALVGAAYAARTAVAGTS